jgi:hypothetical protein
MRLIILLLIFTSCGPGSHPVQVINQEETPIVETIEEVPEEPNKWTYLAILKPLNQQFSGSVNGSVTLDLEDDRFLADVRVALAPGSILHFQSVHAGERCPSLDDDVNQDGIIDPVEGMAVYGKRLIPLDGNLNSQRAGITTAPLADRWGNYIYVRMASFERMMSDLRREEDQDEILTKLSIDEYLNLSSRVVVIYGVSPSVSLPGSVEKIGQWGLHQSMPIACGIFKKVKGPPGMPYEDDFLGEIETPEDEIPEILRPGGVQD